MTKPWGGGTAAQKEAYRLYALASFLLGNAGHSYFYFSANTPDKAEMTAKAIQNAGLRVIPFIVAYRRWWYTRERSGPGLARSAAQFARLAPLDCGAPGEFLLNRRP